MGLFEVAVRVGTLEAGRPKFTEQVSLFVDTGAMYSMIPSHVLERAGVPRLGDVAVELANGTRVSKPYGMAVLEVAGHPIATNVLFGEPGDMGLLGVVALETASLAVDPEHKRLVPVAAIQA